MKIQITNLTPKLSEIIQNFLFGERFVWGGSRTQDVRHTDAQLLYIDPFNKELWTGIGVDETSSLDAQTQFGELVSLISKPSIATVKLSTQYTAAITKDHVTVGCSTFEADKVLEVAEKIKELRK